MTPQQRRILAAVVIAIGLLALAVGVIYFTVEAKSLPSILGQLKGYTGHRSHRGIAALVVGVLLLVVGVGVLASDRRSSH